MFFREPTLQTNKTKKIKDRPYTNPEYWDKVFYFLESKTSAIVVTLSSDNRILIMSEEDHKRFISRLKYHLTQSSLGSDYLIVSEYTQGCRVELIEKAPFSNIAHHLSEYLDPVSPEIIQSFIDAVSPANEEDWVTDMMEHVSLSSPPFCDEEIEELDLSRRDFRLA